MTLLINPVPIFKALTGAGYNYKIKFFNVYEHINYTTGNLNTHSNNRNRNNYKRQYKKLNKYKNNIIIMNDYNNNKSSNFGNTPKDNDLKTQ